jgi:thioredoxin-like negative regulator of GroEL
MAEASLLEFWAPWCKPCKVIEPALDELAKRLPVVRVNADEEPDLAARHEVLSLPTVVLLVDGEPRGSVVGARPLAYFESWLAEMLPAGELGHDA